MAAVRPGTVGCGMDQATQRASKFHHMRNASRAGILLNDTTIGSVTKCKQEPKLKLSNLLLACAAAFRSYMKDCSQNGMAELPDLKLVCAHMEQFFCT